MSKPSVKVRLVADPGLGDGLALPLAVAESLGVPQADTITVRVGGNQRQAPLTLSAGIKVVRIGRALADALYLPLPKTLWVRYDGETQTVRFGPVVAVFAVKRRRAGPRSRRLFGVRTLDMRQLMRHGTDLGLLTYVISPEGVDPSRDYLVGYVPYRRRWARKRLPLPDVVYDRIQARSWERRPSTRVAKEYLRSLPNTKYFNEGFFDKWNLHQRLMQHEGLRQYLPETQPMAGPQSLRSFLSHHSAAFIKPTEGSQGKGIVRISRRGDRYEWRIGSRRLSTTRFDALYRHVRRIQRQQRYIMQPDLQLARLGGAPFDVRLLMQRNETGEWKRTKAYVRVAAKGSLTSNLSRGGTAMRLRSVLRARFGRARRRIENRIHQAAAEILQGLDQVLDGPLGEVGLDLGIDRTGRVWLIEVNAKPFRKVFDAGPKRSVRLSFRRPMAYAKHLAQF